MRNLSKLANSSTLFTSISFADPTHIHALNEEAAFGGYQEFPPHPNLANHVECIWTLFGSPLKSASTRVLPDGCIDILFDFETNDAAEGLVIGAMTKALVSSRRQLIGIRFKPGGASPFFNLPMCEMTDLAVGLGELWQDHKAICEGLWERKTVSARIGYLQQTLMTRLQKAKRIDPRITRCREVLARQNYQVSVAELSEKVALSRQHLRRLFEAHIGLNPKEFIRSMRLQELVRKVKAGEGEKDWAAMAVELGYYDQSHMIGDFRDLVGLTPTEFFTPNH